MAGGRLKHRHLSRKSSHRQALLRNLVSSLIEHESISTSWHKAKEAQRLAEKLITHGKNNTKPSRWAAMKWLYNPQITLPKLFNDLRERYKHRPGGYTRVLRIEPIKEDQAPSAILELVDGPKDMRFALTARTVARAESQGRKLNDMTLANIHKVTRFRQDGEKGLLEMVERFKKMGTGVEVDEEVAKKRVYPDLPQSR